MRYGKQRATLALLIILLPFVAAAAFLQTPYVSDLVLQFALKIARFKTGLKIDAQSWSVYPLSFEASLEKLSVIEGPLSFKAPALKVQVSPLGFVIGKLHIRKVEFVSPVLSGRIPGDLTSNTGGEKEKETETLWQKDLPKFVGEFLSRANEEIKKRGVTFERLVLQGMHSEIQGYTLESGDIEIENLDAGQARLEWHLNSLRIAGKVEEVALTEANLALIKNAQNEFYFVLPQFEFKPATQKENILNLNGRWPGDLRVSAAFDLGDLVEWLNKSPVVGELGVKRARGTVGFEGNITFSRKKIEKVNGDIKAQDLALDEYLIKALSAKVKGKVGDIHLTNLALTLPTGAGDAARWRNTITADDIQFDEKSMKGAIRLDQVGLCSILKATDVQTCHVSFMASGPAEFEGTLSPFELRATPKFAIEGLFVATDGLKSRDNREDEIVSTFPLVLDGRVTVNADAVSFAQASLHWPQGSQLVVNGKIQYDPTIVDLLVESHNSQLSEMFDKFLDLSPQGMANLTAKIFYSSLVPKEVGQTRVLGRVSIENVGVESQNFGTVIGPINYANRSLRIGPLRLASGGGKATVDGTLNQTPKGSFLNIGAVADRLELTGVLPESKSEIFRGFVSGTGTLRGYTNPNSSEALGGPIELRFDTFKAFGVPFQKGTVKAKYRNQILDIVQMVGTKDKSTIRLTGSLNPKGGTELQFKSDDFRIKDLALDPNLEILQSGFVNIDGFWRPAQGWGLDGNLSQLKIAGVELPPGLVKLSGDQNQFNAAAKLGDLIRFEFKSMAQDQAPNSPVKLSVNLKDNGLYAAFAYLKGWTGQVGVRTSGTLEADWSPKEGNVKTRNLLIKGPQGQGGKVETLLRIDGEHELAWNEHKLQKNTFSFNGPTTVKFENSPAEGSMNVNATLPLALLDLIIPNLRFIDGTINIAGEIPLPPDVATIRAQGSIDKGTLLIRGVGQPIENVSTRVGISRQQLNFSQGRGNLGGGDVSIEGVYKIDLRKPGANLQIGLNRAHVIVMEDVPADVTGDLVLKGEEPPYFLGGRVQVTNAIYSKDFKQDAPIINPNVKPILKFGLDVELGSGVQVKNTVASTGLVGRLIVSGDDIRPDVQGKINLTSGSLFANETEFKILQGVVAFPGGQALPIVNLQANTVLKNNNQDYKIELRARGSADNLNIEFSSDPALSNADIVNLLAFGVLRNSSDTSSASGDLMGAARVEALQALFLRAVGQSLDKSTGIQIRFKSEQNSQTGEYVPTVSAVKKLSDRMTVTYGRSLDITAPENNAQVDYKLLNNVNLTGVYQGGVETQKPSVGFDLRFHFEVK